MVCMEDKIFLICNCETVTVKLRKQKLYVVSQKKKNNTDFQWNTMSSSLLDNLESVMNHY